jgi:hypothetical protein
MCQKEKRYHYFGEENKTVTKLHQKMTLRVLVDGLVPFLKSSFLARSL